MNYETIRKQHNFMQQIYQNGLTQQIYLQQNDFAQLTHLLNQNQNSIENQYFIDRQYRRKKSFNRREDFRDRNDKFQARRSKKCFVCEKLEC